MGIELSLDPPRQEGRLTRSSSRDSAPPSAPDRFREPDNFASIFQDRSVPFAAPVLLPKRAAILPVSPAEAPLEGSDESIDNQNALTDRTEMDVTADNRTDPDEQPTNAVPGDAGPVLPEPEIIATAIPFPQRASEEGIGGTVDARPMQKAQEPSAQTPQNLAPTS